MLFLKRSIGTIGVMGGVHSVPSEFCESLARMVAYNYEYLLQPQEIIHLPPKPPVSYHAHARNMMAASFLGDWLFMIDSDHQFEPDLLARMLALFNMANLDVLTGLYQLKAPPYLPCIYQWNEDTQGFLFVAGWDKGATLIPVDCAGAGCLMVRRRVFDRIRNDLGENPFDVMSPWSEDFSFFVRLKKLGIKSFCAPQIESNHLISKAITIADYDPKAAQFAA